MSGALIAGGLLLGTATWHHKTCTYTLIGNTNVLIILGVGLIVGIIVPVIAIVYSAAKIFYVIVQTHNQITAQGGDVDVSQDTNSTTLMMSIRSGKNVLLMCLA